MQPITQGKEAVLDYLEKRAVEKSGGMEGEYMLTRDDDGKLVAYVAGPTFIGTGTVVVGGQVHTVSDGVLTHIQKK